MSRSRRVWTKFLLPGPSNFIASAETEKAIRLKLMTREQEGKVKPGLTGWVNSGIKIQEAQ